MFSTRLIVGCEGIPERGRYDGIKIDVAYVETGARAGVLKQCCQL